MDKDQYDEQAERLLPCDCNNRDGREGHFSSCAGYWRDTFAEELREAGESLRIVVNQALGFKKEIANLRAELERTQTALGQANADLMGCRDGALVRDLRAENDQLILSVDQISKVNDDLQTVCEALTFGVGQVEAERDQLKAKLAEAEKRGMIRACEVLETIGGRFCFDGFCDEATEAIRDAMEKK